MDTHLAMEIGRIRETQLQIRDILTEQRRDIAAVLEYQQKMVGMLKNGRRSDGLLKWITLLRPIGYGVALWGAALAALAHMANGGDLITLLQMFVRLM